MRKRDFVATSARGGAIVATGVVVQYIIGFAVQITLVRMLEPEVFGSFAFASTVAMFLSALTNWHGDKYVIHQEDSPRRAINVAFALELAAAVLLVALVFLLAPLVMSSLGKGELTLYVQVLAFAFLYNPLCRPRCLLERNLSFFRAKFPFVVSQVASAVLAITLAHFGLGIWSLLVWRLSVPIGEVLILWMIAPYRPRLEWRADLAKDMLRFSWPLTISAFLAFFYYNVDYFIIGHFLEDGKRQLGYYWLGFQAGSYFLMFRQVLADVLFPVFARLDDDEFKSRVFRRLTQVVAAAFLLPTLFIVFFAKDLVLLVYGEKWLPAVFPFQIIFITALTRAISSNIGYFLWSRGQTRPQLVMATIFSLLLPPAAYWATIQHGINGTAISVLIVQIAVTFVMFECYIKPVTAHGTLYFFAWPWVLSALTLAMACCSESLVLSLPLRLGISAGLLTAAYFAVLRSALCDVRIAMKSIRSRNDAELDAEAHQLGE